MVIDSEKLKLLVYKYAGWSETARKAQEEMDAANREANAAMDEITAYLTEVNAANEKMEGEMVRLQKAEAERARASIKPEHRPSALVPIVPCCLCKRWQAVPEAGEHAGWCRLLSNSRPAYQARCENFEGVEITDVTPTRAVEKREAEDK